MNIDNFEKQHTICLYMVRCMHGIFIKDKDIGINGPWILKCAGEFYDEHGLVNQNVENIGKSLYEERYNLERYCTKVENLEELWEKFQARNYDIMNAKHQRMMLSLMNKIELKMNLQFSSMTLDDKEDRTIVYNVCDSNGKKFVIRIHEPEVTSSNIAFVYQFFSDLDITPHVYGCFDLLPEEYTGIEPFVCIITSYYPFLLSHHPDRQFRREKAIEICKKMKLLGYSIQNATINHFAYDEIQEKVYLKELTLVCFDDAYKYSPQAEFEICDFK